MSCCGGNCGCGSGCKCGSGCGGCKMFPGLTSGEGLSSGEGFTTIKTIILGVSPVKGSFGGFEVAGGSENDCKCGSNCSCGSCSCGK